MSNITITNNIKDKPSESEAMRAGQFYRSRVRGDVFMVARHRSAYHRCLIRIKDGVLFDLATNQGIEELFGSKDALDLIENIEIVLS